MDERIANLNAKYADLDARVRTLEAELAERRGPVTDAKPAKPAMSATDEDELPMFGVSEVRAGQPDE